MTSKLNLKKQNIPTEQQMQVLAKLVWLRYYNGHLYKEGVITEREHSRMSSLINRRYSRPWLKS